jgi:hypothetical protein
VSMRVQTELLLKWLHLWLNSFHVFPSRSSVLIPTEVKQNSGTKTMLKPHSYVWMCELSASIEKILMPQWKVWVKTWEIEKNGGIKLKNKYLNYYN